MRLEIHIIKTSITLHPHGHHANSRIAGNLAAMESVIVGHHHLLDAVHLGHISKLGRGHAAFAPQAVNHLVKELMQGTAHILLFHRVSFTEQHILGLRRIQETFHLQHLADWRYLARNIVLGMGLTEFRQVKLVRGNHVESTRKVGIASHNQMRLFFDPVNGLLFCKGNNANGHRLEDRNTHVYGNRIDGRMRCHRQQGQRKGRNAYKKSHFFHSNPLVYSI